jgi:NagD protein
LGKPNGFMFQQARRKLAGFLSQAPEQVIMIGDTMETDIRGAVEAGMESYLVLSGSTQFEMVGDYVYQPTRILQNVGELVEEIKTGKPGNPAFTAPSEPGAFHGERFGIRHQTDIFAFHKPRPRPAMTK